MTEEFEQAIGHDRRAFMKRLIIGGAFAAPVVSSFTMSGVQSVFAATPGSVAAAPNTLPDPPAADVASTPPGPELYGRSVQCFTVTDAGVQAQISDGPVTIGLNVPSHALPIGTVVCIYGGNLALLDNVTPGTPLSAYAVVWNSPGSHSPDAGAPVTLTVTDPAVSAGQAIHVFNKNTGAIESAGTATGSPARWVVSFVEDPAFVVTNQAGAAGAITAQPTTTG